MNMFMIMDAVKLTERTALARTTGMNTGMNMTMNTKLVTAIPMTMMVENMVMKHWPSGTFIQTKLGTSAAVPGMSTAA